MVRFLLHPSLLMLAIVLAGCASRPVVKTARYACNSGRPLTVTYRGADTAVLQMGPRQIEMTPADSPIGARYASRELQWVTRRQGDQRVGTLFTRGNDGGPGNVVEQCIETDQS